jgi:hypothetical protein
MSQIREGDLVQLRYRVGRHAGVSAETIFIVTQVREYKPGVSVAKRAKVFISYLLTLQPYPGKFVRYKNLKKYISKPGKR